MDSGSDAWMRRDGRRARGMRYASTCRAEDVRRDALAGSARGRWVGGGGGEAS